MHDVHGKALERLVEQDEARAADQGTPDRQHLLLAAGQRTAIAAAPLAEPGEDRENVVERQRRRRRQSGNVEILLDGQPAENTSFLGNELQPEPGDRVTRQRFDGGAFEADRAGARMQHAGKRFQRGAFAGAVAAQQRHHFALAHRHRDVEQDMRVAVIGIDPIRLDHIRRGCRAVHGSAVPPR